MSSAGTKTAGQVLREMDLEENLAERYRRDPGAIPQRRIARLHRLWTQRSLLAKCIAGGAAFSLVIALLIPSRFASTTRLMPPDPPQGQSMALLSALTGRLGASFGLGSLGSDLLGMKTSAELFS